MSGCCSTASRTEAEAAVERRMLALRIGVAAVFAMMTMAVAVVGYVEPFGPLSAAEEHGLRWAMAVLSAPVVLGAGAGFVFDARAELRARRPGMATLVVLGTSGAYVYSWWAVLAGRDVVYFDTASMIVAFLLVGRAIETRLTAAAADALDRWLRTLPARTVLADGQEVPTERVPVGAEFVVRAGDRVPLDGRVVLGNSELERAALSGESIPTAVGPGSEVEAGAVNLLSPLRIRVTAGVGQRMVDDLVHAVRESSRKRPRIQRLADRFARRLVYAALGIAAAALVVGALTAGVDGAILRALAVLVVACPCVAGLATPVAVAAAAVRAASAGVAVKSPDVFERLAGVDTAVFDKTGTLTSTALRVRESVAATGASTSEVLAWAAAVEQGVRHPIADALLRAAEGVPLPSVTAVRVVPGRGAMAESDRGPVLVGSAALLADHGIRAPKQHSDRLTWVHVAVGGRWRGALGITAPLRPGIVGALKNELDLDIRIATGDAAPVARAVGSVLGVRETAVAAELAPFDKAALLHDLAAQGRATVYVGDGINDGPALAAADVGVAVSNASAVADAAAHLVLRRGGAERLPELLRFARRVDRVMRINLGWALLYNVVALPLAILGHVPPALAALMMVFSSALVLTNSARLLRQPDSQTQGVGR